MSMEQKILELSASDFEGSNMEPTIRRLASELDEAGYNVSRHGGNLLQLRAAVAARAQAGTAMLERFNEAVDGLTLDDLADIHAAAVKLVREVGESWPAVKELDRRPHVLELLEDRRLDLLIADAKGMAEDEGIRFLIAKEVAAATIMNALGVTEAKHAEVTAAIAAEQAEAARVAKLLDEVADTSDEDKARHLITKDVTDENIVKLAGIGQAVIDAAKEAMAEELREKKRLADEAAAAKAAAAEGPALDAIPRDEMLEHIEAIREIMEFSDVEDEIRQMCEQSNIPKSLVDVAVADPDKLDELEAAAEA
jgi:hypothetical protein